MILPPGGRKETIDADIFATAIREVEEEVGLELRQIDGDFVDKDGSVIFTPEPVLIDNYTFPDGASGQDNLYFFCLKDQIDEASLEAEKQGFYITREQVKQRHFKIGKKFYGILKPSIKGAILRVMLD